jgi:DNA polymerase-4
MRRAETIERLYLDFDGFFASVMQQADPRLRGKPVGVIPFDPAVGDATVVIACSKEAKARGCSNVMRVAEARALCPDMVFVTQRPDLYRRAHNTLINEITCEIPVETVKSIDELSCILDKSTIAEPEALAARIKSRIRKNVGDQITCSIGFAANRLLAKIACKMDKPNGVTIWHPENMPAPLFTQPIDIIPGIGKRMQARLQAAGIITMEELWNSQPKQLRAVWHSVNGERMWYALHGYDVFAMPTDRGMFGHGRVLPPEQRDSKSAAAFSRVLLTKAARRMRRDGFFASKLWLALDMRQGAWYAERDLPSVRDDQACLGALKLLWDKANREIPPRHEIIRVFVNLSELSPANARQLDLLINDDVERQKCEVLTDTIDTLNRKFGKRVVTIGEWTPPGEYAGAKIAYNRIPSAEDFM